MDQEKRKEIIEKVAWRWKPEGIKSLKTFGNFQKYSPIFHYHISEPYNLNENFIYITELFGHINQTPDDALPMNFLGMRRQLQGNYKGLNQIVLQGLSEPNIVPYEIEKPGIGKCIVTSQYPTYQLNKICKEDKKLFDNALLYLEHITQFSFPKSFHIDNHYKFLTSTHNI